MTIREAVTSILDNSPPCVFSLWGLTDEVGLAVGSRTMPHTVRDACRTYADAAGAEFYCIDRAHSKYKYVPGFKIAGALTGIE